MKALVFSSFIAAILLGPAISFVGELVSIRNAINFQPAMSDAERYQMGNLTVNEAEAILGKRKIKITRWEWLRNSIPYSYYWKHVAFNAIVPGSGVFLGCVFVGWMELRRVKQPQSAT